MKLIIINGLPGTGKTTIAKPLAAELDLPLIAKDTIKEFLFNELGAKDRQWSAMLGRATNDFIYLLTDEILAAGHSVIIENAFEKAFALPRLQPIISKHRPDIIELYCMVAADIRRQRFIYRNKFGNRHPGHADNENYLTDTEPEPYEKYAVLEIGEVLRLDTTEPVDIAKLVDSIRNAT